VNRYSISIIQQCILLSHLVSVSIAIPVVIYYYTGSALPVYQASYVYLFYFLFNVLPTLILHFQYYLENRKTVLVINPTSRLFSCSKNGKEEWHSFDEIEKIIYVASYGKDTGVYSFGEYRYCTICMKDNTRFNVTCVMVNQIEERLGKAFGIEFEKKYRILALLKYGKLKK
jgi:hypothetical protein